MLALFSNHLSTLILLAILLLAVVLDLRAHRIPNWLSLAAILSGLGLHTYYFGVTGLQAGVLGMLVAFAFFLPFYVLKGMGAGDVKLMMGVGCFLGPMDTFLACGFTLLVGAGMGAAILFWRNGFGSWARRYLDIFSTAVRTFRWIYIPPASNEAAATRFPYAAAIAAGTTLALWWLLLLDPLFFEVQLLWRS